VVQDPPPAQQSGNTVTAVVTVCSSDHGIRSGPAWISRSSDLSVRMRTGPGLNNSEIRQLESGTRFDIIDGPRCVDGYVWWEIRHNNRTGWIAEGTASESWIVRTVTATVTVTRRDTPQLIDSGPLGSIPLYEDGTMRARIDYRVLITYTQSGSDITVRTITVRYHVDPVASARVFCWAAVTADLQDSRGNSLRSDGWYGWSGWLIFVSPDEEASVDLTPFQSVGSSGVVDVGINFSCFRFISNQQIAEDSRSPLPPEDSTPAFVRERINVP